MITAIEQLMAEDTAGDPMSTRKWTRRTTAKIARELRRLRICVSRRTVGRLLHGLDYSLRVNRKQLGSNASPDRDRQFRYIARQRRSFQRHGDPIISVDAKKRELVGNFKNPGARWDRTPALVKDHDFRSESTGIAIPYGVYDLAANRGFVQIGVSHDTPAFAVRAIATWWRTEGHARYAARRRLLILADTGGSNGYRCSAWKTELQRQLCDRFGIAVTVAHYPTGASKWNPIEHRLFSEISKQWAGEPLTSYEKILRLLRQTRTATGLTVRAILTHTIFPTKVKAAAGPSAQLALKVHRVLPNWNYTIRPQTA